MISRGFIVLVAYRIASDMAAGGGVLVMSSLPA